MLNKPVPAGDITQLIAYRRILLYKLCNPSYVQDYSVAMIASKVIRLTVGCVSRCNTPEPCIEERCDITIVPNPTSTTTSTSTTLVPTTTTTSSSSTSTSTSTSTSSSTSTSTSTSSTTTTSTTVSCCTPPTNLALPGNTILFNGVNLTFSSTQPAGLSIWTPSTIMFPACLPSQTLNTVLTGGLSGDTDWDYTINFDQPVNNVKIQVINYSASSFLQNQEQITFTTDTDVAEIINCDGCDVIIESNSIKSVMDTNGSGTFTINATTPYTSLTLTPTMLGVNPGGDEVTVFLRICGFINPSTTSTTTSSSSTTTTTTTIFFPRTSPCVWSRDIDVVGSIDVYDVASNTTVSISVPNDFATPTGIAMQASTNNKLWIGDGINTIKEWDIMQETLGLSFVRNINVSSFAPNQNQPSTIAAIDDVTILLGSDRVSGGPAEVGYWDITSPVSTISLGNSVASRSVGIVNTFGITQKLTGIIYTNSGNVILSCRNNFASSTNNVGNFIIQYTGLPDPDIFISWVRSIGTIRVQDTIDFTLGYTGRKAFDLFALDGIIYLVNPETSDLYEVSQTPQYGITLSQSNLGYSDTQTFCSSTGCSNVNFEGYSPDCIPTSLPALRSTPTGPYIGPVNFTYLSMTVQASSVIYQGTRNADAAYSNVTFPCSGVSIGSTPTMYTNGNIGSCSLSTPAFDYTLTFPSPVNNIPFRLAVLDGNDDFRFTTNGGTPTITANVNCNVTIIGNELYTDDAIFFGSGSGEFVITAPSDYTEITISGTNCGNGGPIWLGCQNDPVVTTSTTTLFPPTTTTTTTVEGVNTIFTYFEGITP
jgi:hypothetical protein